jgi:hypothetical protein
MGPVKWTPPSGLLPLRGAGGLADGWSSQFLGVCTLLATLMLGPARRGLARAALALRRWMVRERWRRNLRARAAAGAAGGVPDGGFAGCGGGCCRAVGSHRRGRTQGAVLASYLGTTGESARGGGGASGRWELQGVDFAIALDGGERVRVVVARSSVVADPPCSTRPSWTGRRWWRGRCAGSWGGQRVARLYEEDVIAAGDVVEVLGFLEHRVDPRGESGPRGTPLMPVLCARPLRRLLVRPCSADAERVPGPVPDTVTLPAPPSLRRTSRRRTTAARGG